MITESHSHLDPLSNGLLSSFLSMKLELIPSALGLAARLLALAVYLAFLQPPSASAQTSPATLPDLQLATAGGVATVALQPDGKVIIGGSFTSVNGFSRNNLARLNADGSLDPSWNPNAQGFVYAVAVSGADIYVGGQFTSVGGLSRNNLAKLNSTARQAPPLWDPSPPTFCTYPRNRRLTA